MVLVRSKHHEVPDDRCALIRESRLRTDGAANSRRSKAEQIVGCEPSGVACRAGTHGDGHDAAIWRKCDDVGAIVAARRPGRPIPAAGEMSGKVAIGKGVALVAQGPEVEGSQDADDCDERADDPQGLLHGDGEKREACSASRLWRSCKKSNKSLRRSRNQINGAASRGPSGDPRGWSASDSTARRATAGV